MKEQRPHCEGQSALMYVDDLLCIYCEEEPCAHVAENSEDVKKAKRLCASCPLKASCRDEADSRREKYGIWGGETANERKSRWRKAARAKNAAINALKEKPKEETQ